MADDLAIGPRTHTVSYAGQQFKVMYEQAVGIATAMANARFSHTTLVGLPVTDADTGVTIGRYILVGPGIPIMIEGPVMPEVGM